MLTLWVMIEHLRTCVLRFDMRGMQKYANRRRKERGSVPVLFDLDGTAND